MLMSQRFEEYLKLLAFQSIQYSRKLLMQTLCDHRCTVFLQCQNIIIHVMNSLHMACLYTFKLRF